jgi:hypothetical protein
MKEAATLLKLSEMRGMEYSPAKDGFFQPSKSTPPLTANTASTEPRPPILPATNPENSKPKPLDVKSYPPFIRFHPSRFALFPASPGILED